MRLDGTRYRSLALGFSTLGVCRALPSIAVGPVGTEAVTTVVPGPLRHEQEVLMTSIQRLTQEQVASLAYTVAELRQLAREHGVLIPRGTLHHEVVAKLTAAGVELPAKPL